MNMLALGLGLMGLMTAQAVEVPDIMQELKTGAQSSQDVAVVVGIESYPFLPNVPFAKRDAEAFYRYLVYTRGVPYDRVKLMVKNPTADEVQRAVADAASRAGKGGTVWVYFAGHGAASTKDRERMLLGVDTKADAESLETRSIRVTELEDIIGRSVAAQGVILVDACYAGVGRDGGELLAGKRFTVPAYAADAKEKVTVWSAASANELSGPFEPAGHGLFTYFAIGALRGWADGELDGSRDGSVTLAEAQAYAHKAIRTVSEGSQQPTMEERSSAQRWVLTSASQLEAGPDIPALILQKSGPPAPAPQPSDPLKASTASISTNGSGDYLAELERLRQVQTIRKQQQQEEREARERKLAQARDQILTEARQAWEITADVAAGGGPEGELALRKFIERYVDAKVTLDGTSHPVQVPQLQSAEQMLANWDNSPPEPVVPVAPVAQEPTWSVTTTGNLVSDIGRLANPGTSDWDAQVQDLLLQTYDANNSRSLETVAEVTSIGCDVWTAIDDGVRSNWGNGLWTTYGMDPEQGIYIGYALGIPEDQRPIGGAALEQCGLDQEDLSQLAQDTFGSDTSWPAPYSSGNVTSYIESLPQAGSGEWDAYVGMALIGKYDRNDNGLIDTNNEVDAIACSDWKAIDAGVNSNFGVGVQQVYGFSPQYTWAAGGLGLSTQVRSRADGALTRCLGGGGSASGGSTDVASYIRSVSGGGSTDWDTEVLSALVSAYDSDRSGSIESSEVGSIGCDVLSALDDGVKQSWGMGFYTIYGVDPNLSWVGSSVGFDINARSTLGDKFRSCGLVEGGATAPAPAPAPSGNPAGSIRGLSGPATSSWDRQVGQILVGNYDTNGSGAIDNRGEVQAISCDVWAAMDQGVKAGGYEAGLDQIYGFHPDFIWVSGLGIDERVRPDAHSAITSCLGGGGSSSNSSSSGGDGDMSTEELIVAAIVLMENPASGEWDQTVYQLLVAGFDQNGSGSIDTSSETRSIPCEVWQAMEYAVQNSKYESNLKIVYGFRQDLIWIGNSLGFADSQRGQALSSMESCGI